MTNNLSEKLPNEYLRYFQYGSLLDIEYDADTLVLPMISCELMSEEVQDDMFTSNRKMQGKLHVEGINSITINDNPLSEKLEYKYDDGKILDFKISDNSLEINIEWKNFKPKKNEYTKIHISAEKISWEPVPFLEDSYNINSRIDLDFEKTLSFFQKHIQVDRILSEKVLQHINWEEGRFFTFLPSGAAFEQLYDFEKGWILPPFGKNCRGNYEIVPTMDEEIAKYICEFVKRPNRLALFEHYNFSPTNRHIFIEGIDITFFGNEVYYFANYKTPQEAVSYTLSDSSLVWHSLTVLSEGMESLPKQLTEEDINNVCSHVTHIITTAYDREGFIIWEKALRTNRDVVRTTKVNCL